VQQAAPATASHTEAVRLVDDQQCALPAAHVVQRTQGSQYPVGGEHRVGHHDGTLFVALRQRRFDGGDIAVRRHDDAGARQPAGVHQRRMGQRVGHQQGPHPGQRDHGTEVGGVAR
jgi:hypothetical protein